MTKGRNKNGRFLRIGIGGAREREGIFKDRERGGKRAGGEFKEVENFLKNSRYKKILITVHANSHSTCLIVILKITLKIISFDQNAQFLFINKFNT